MQDTVRRTSSELVAIFFAFDFLQQFRARLALHAQLGERNRLESLLTDLDTWLHPAGRARFKRVRALLKVPPLLSPAEQRAWQVPAADLSAATAACQPPLGPPAALYCPGCGHALQLIAHWQPQQRTSLTAVQRTTRPP